MNIQQLMQQAQKMQKQMQVNQEKMKSTEFTGESGNGKIIITIDGAYNTKRINISEELIDKDSKDLLEDLLIVAFNEAKKKVDETNNSSINSITGGIGNLNGLF